MNAIAHASAVPVTGPKLDGRRVRAGIIDLVVVVAGALGLGLLGSDQPRDMPGFDFVVLGWMLYYYFACESSGGQTLGKRLMKLRVVRVDGRPAGMGEVAVRTVLRVIDGIAFYVDGVGVYIVGLIVMLVTGERRGRLGDLAGGTMVVDASAPVAPAAAAAPAPVEEPAHVESAVPSPTITLPPRPAPVVEEPQPEPVEPEPPLADMASPSLQELAQDVAEVRAAEPEPEPEPAPEPDPEPVVEEPVTVRSVETVSAIDLVMGEDEDDEASDSPPSPQH